MKSEEMDNGGSKLQLDRRELMKLGAGAAGLAALASGKAASGQASGVPSTPANPPAPGSMRKPGEIAPFTALGYKNNFNRLGKNGPMDDTTAKIVKYVYNFKPSDVTPAAKKQYDRLMIDSLASIVGGFEEEGPRASAELARMCPAGPEKCTVLGYNLTTTPEMATFANGCLIREVDWNDTEFQVHYSTVIPAALAMGEALHKSGADVMAAIMIAYELQAVPAGGESVVAAMAAGKLMGLDEDRLANALTLALTPHIALNKGVGAMSMWKGMRSAESAKCGVWAALMARAGVTGPPQPFEGRGGYWASLRSTDAGPSGFARGIDANGMGRKFNLPVTEGENVLVHTWYKRRPAEASSQGILYLMPEIRTWLGGTENVAAIHIDISYSNWEEICDAPKWDPQNRQTADHSLPFITAQALIAGDIFLDSYREDKFLNPVAQDLLAKTTISPVNGWVGNGPARIEITKKNGEKKFWDTYEGRRVVGNEDYPPLTTAEQKEKLDRACAFMKVNPAQRDQAYKIWGDTSSLKDFADAMKVVAKFGQPKPFVG